MILSTKGLYTMKGYEEPAMIALSELAPDEDFMKFVEENDGRNFKQGSRQEQVRKLAMRDDVAKVAKIVNELIYDIKKLTKRVEELEFQIKGYKTDVYGNYYLP